MSASDPLQLPDCELTERFVPADEGVQLRVLSWVPTAAPDAPPILFVAGWVSAVEGWIDLLRALARARPVHYLETREKKSARLDPAKKVDARQFCIPRLAEDVVNVARALALGDRALAMGSSLGSTVILEAMKDDRLPVRAAFLVGPNVRFRYPWWGPAAIRLPTVTYLAVARLVLFYLRHFRVDSKKEPEQIRRYEATILNAHPRRTQLSAIGFQGYEIWPKLETVARPVALACAPTDRLHAENDVARLLAALRQGTRVECPSNKYMHSAPLADDVERYLATLPAPA